MKILLSDDDKLIRFTLKSMLTDLLSDDYMFIEACDGQEMINRCIDSDPDIAFVDINMPCLDGISAIETCKKYSPHTEFVILTGYSDFAYAQKCISLGVTDYLLKPVDTQQLSDTLQKARRKLEHSMTQENALFQLSVLNLIQELPPASETILLPGQDETLLAFTLFLDCRDNFSAYNQVRNQLVLALKDIAIQYSVKHHYSLIYSAEGLPRFLLKVSKDNVPSVIQRIRSLCLRLSTGQMRICALFSRQDSISGLLADCESVEQHSYLRLQMNPGDVCEYRDFPSDAPSSDFLKHVSGMLNAFFDKNEPLYTQNLNYIYKTWHDLPVPADLTAVSSYIRQTTGLETSADSLKAFCRSFVDLSDHMYDMPECAPESKIDAILKYINKSYMNDISMNQIAEHFCLTPGYLSQLFHKETGTKFIDYLTNLRITHAKRILLTDFDAPIKDIALMCGYYSPRHFSSTFKKVTGIYPSEHRKKYAST